MTNGKDEGSAKGKVVKNDRYTVYDEDTGEYVERSYSQDEINNHLSELKEAKSSIVSEYEGLQGFQQGSIINSFKDESQAIIDEIEGLKGDLYTEEGKKAEIKKQLQELAESKKSEANEVTKDYQEKQANLLQEMDEELRNSNDNLTTDQVAAINLSNSELQGRIKGELYGWNDTRTLEHEFKTLVEEAKKDKTLARFLENNYYIFLEKAQSLDTDEMDKSRATHNIMKHAEQLKKSSYSNKERALIAVKENVSQKSFNLHDVRLIDHHLRSYLSKY